MSVAEIRRETFYKLTNSADVPEVPSGNRNLYAISKNSGTYTSGVSEFVQNIETGEISWKTASVSDSQFGGFTATIGTTYRNVYGIKIPVVQGKDILVSLTDDRLIKNYVMFWGEDNTLVKKTIKYTTNHFKVQANQLENVSYLTFRIGVKENTQEIGTLIKTKIKVEYGNVYTDWTPAPEDFWSTTALVPTQEEPYLWKFEYIYYSDGSVEVTQPVNLTKQNAQRTSRDTIHNVRIAVRDSTDSHNVAFFDNISGIRYQSANLQRFLAGSASILTIEYNSKDIDTIRTGCKLAFIYKQRAYWLNIMGLNKKGYKVEITAYSLGLELNQEERGAHKPANAMSFAEYLAYYDPEHALEIGVNEVADKRIKLEWTGTDTILARLFSIANSFDAELEFTVELNQDYSLKRQVLNIYKKGNLGSNRVASPIRVGRGLKVINYSDNLKELRTAVRATGKDGLTIDGLNKKVYDDDGNLLYYSNGMTVYAPQSRDKYPSVGKKSNDNWIIKELGETEYSTKEALWGYMLGELKKICVPEITYDIEGAVDGDVGDTRTLIDDVHYDPPLYVQGRISELTEDLITGKVTKSTLTNFERKYSQVASELLKQVEQLANDAAPYIVRLSTDNGYNFKNGKGTSTITAKLEKYGKIVNANWKWLINNNIVSDNNSVTINASQVIGTLNVVAIATVDGNELAREYITFTNSDDGVGIKSIKRYYTTNDQAEGVTAGGQNWSTKPTTVTADKNYMWSYDVITYTNDTSLVTEPAVIGARGNDGLDADTTGVTEALDKAKQELTALSANIEKVRDDSLAAVEEAKQQLTTVANDLGTAKQDLQTQASQLKVQASAQSELTKRVSSVEETANGTKTTVSELSKTVEQNSKDITSVTARTKTVEDDLTSTKTTLLQVQTTANSASQKAATLETGLDGVKADLAATTATADTTKTNLANYQASIDQAVASLQSSLQTTDGNVSSLQTQINAVPGQITSAVSAVEGKIPTEIGGRNLYALSRNASVYTRYITEFVQNVETGEISFKVAGTDPFFGIHTYAGNAYDVSRGVKIPVKVGQDIAVKLTNELFAKNFVSYFGADDKAVKGFKNYKTNKFVIPADDLEGVSYVTFRFGINEGTQEIGSVHSTKVKVEYGNVYTDWSPAPEDTASQISSLSSRIQQTADGMTLLATKTELNSAKTDLQAGISTATSKADNAQSTANSNAQTISTHTTQISALNTGLQAKVSQSDFDSLSGDVDDLSSELTQTASSITASVSSVETKADNAQTTANSAVSKANAAQTAVNTLDSEVVKSASLNLDNNGFVTKVGKTIDGNKFATMIAQNANNVKIIADEMQVTADMIVDGAVTANKLNVNNLSAVNSNLGKIEGGSLLLQENKTASSSVDNWGTFNRPAHKQGLYMDNHGLASSGAIQRKNGSETTPTDMPLAVLQSGELRFLVVDYNDNLENVLHYGLSDPDYGAIRFEIDSELKRRLTMTSSGYLNFQATNYTNWQSTGVSGCEYMIQGRLVLVNYDVTFSSAGTHTIGSVPQEFVRKSLMLTAKGWSVIPRDKNAQLNPDGSLHILDAEANVNYRGTLVFSY